MNNPPLHVILKSPIFLTKRSKSMEGMYSVPLSELIEKMNLDNLTPGIDTENILIKHIDVNLSLIHI